MGYAVHVIVFLVIVNIVLWCRSINIPRLPITKCLVSNGGKLASQIGPHGDGNDSGLPRQSSQPSEPNKSTAKPSWKDSADVIRAQVGDAALKQFTATLAGQKGLIFDIGLNDGTDTALFLKKGYSVISVDANPKWTDGAKKKFNQSIIEGRLLVLNVGLVEHPTDGGLKFYVSEQKLTHASFDIVKASKNGRYKVSEINVPLVDCQTLLSFFKPAYFVKVDIETLDFVCVRGVAALKGADRPEMLSWENHARHQFDGHPTLTFPGFDMQLILDVAANGYELIKFSPGAGGTRFGPDLPPEISDCYTHSTQWRNITHFFIEGIRCDPEMHTYYDFHVKLLA